MTIETKRRVTAGDIATTLGLAPATVSHVLGGRGDRLRIKTETQERIWGAAREMGYRVNVSARAMRTGRSGNVALVQPELHPYLPFPLLTGLSAALERRNMHLSVAYAVRAALEDVEYLPKVVREWAADGLIVNYIATFPSPFLGAIQEPNIPSLWSPFLDAVHEHNIPSIWVNVKREANCVYPDDYQGGRMAARHLLDLGHRDIAFLHADPIAYPTAHYSAFDRYGGYADEMRDAALPVRALEMPRTYDTYGQPVRNQQPASFLTAMLRSIELPTAFVCYEFDNAVPLLIAAAQCGLRVPEDISLIAFHGWEDPIAGVAVTTIQNCWGDVAEAAVESLEQKIAAPDLPVPSRSIAPVFHPGTTTAPPRKG